MEEHLQKFVERVRRLTENDGAVQDAIASEYARIRQQNGSMKELHGLTTETGGMKENAKKNRYKDILPYDQTRVLLSPIPDYNSDYINANFVQGATQNKTYLATQGPLIHTLVDFWRMIWQYNVQVIVMACKEIEMGKKKCEVYWGSLAEPSTFGPFTVSTVEESCPNEEVIVRTLAVKYSDETRSLSQFQYTAWPDHGIPYVPDGILGMMKLANIRQASHSGPMLIHCSAGCGRTGVICAIDYVNDLLQKKKIGDDFSIMNIVLELRRQRPSAVQTKEQYEFVFHTVAQMFQKILNKPSHRHKNQTQNLLSVYSNVIPPKPALRSVSIGGSSSDPKTRNPPPLRPRSSHPPSSNKMNDTYAVVNKSRQPPASPVVHHYDNLDKESQKNPNTALYSSVKPKTRAKETSPVYDRTLPVNQRGSNASLEVDHSGYEVLPGEFRARNSQLYPPLSKGTSDSHSSTDDDYEYVSNPLKDSSSSNSSSYFSPGGLGFNCRIKKPKGPRDPPAEWNRPER